MCLNLATDAKKQIASEDVVCYKRVLIDRNPDIIPYQGKSFTGIINNIECEGRIQVEFDEAFFCTNYSTLDGCSCVDKLGYDYSWRVSSSVISIIIDGIEVMNNPNFTQFLTPYRYAKVKLGETYTSKLIRKYDAIHVGLHSFTTYEDARRDGDNGVVVKCIIPKGSEYYLGKFGYKLSYASNQLKYSEIVTE